MVTKTCTSCYNPWNASSRHRLCGKCRKKLPHYKDRCPICQVPKCRQSKHCRSCAFKGQRNARWKGGLIKTKKGYLYEYTLDRGYIAQHRLVMERYIGRHLLPSESVHHKNGNRLDNNLSNLELWASSHPSGQRVSDLLNWAEEIILKYKSLPAS